MVTILCFVDANHAGNIGKEAQLNQLPYDLGVSCSRHHGSFQGGYGDNLVEDSHGKGRTWPARTLVRQ